MQSIRAAFIVGLMGTPAFAEYAKVSDDLTILYEVAGTGPQTILFVPGWTMTTQVFEKQLDLFCRADRLSVDRDRPAQPGSDDHDHRRKLT